MFSAGITWDGRTKLVPIHERINSDRYIELIKQTLIPFINTQMLQTKRNYIFMQDGASPHTSKKTTAFLLKNNITVLTPWPAYSPDINPIENLWAILKNNLGGYNFTKKEDLIKKAIQEWNSIDQKIIHNLISSMNNRLKLVRKNDGFITKY